MIGIETQRLEEEAFIYISNLNPIETWLTEGDIWMVFTRTPDYYIFPYVTQNFHISKI
jgi:hypothetical protein